MFKCYWIYQTAIAVDWKSKNPRCFKNIPRDFLPVEYASQSNAWVNSQIFLIGFTTALFPLFEMGLEPKAVLLLDNCSAHPNDDELVSADGKIVAKFLPANVTSNGSRRFGGH